MTNRIVLQLTEIQEYIDVLNQRVGPLTMRTEGRGFLFKDGNAAECQVAMLEPSLLGRSIENDEVTQTIIQQDEETKQRFVGDMTRVTIAQANAMKSAWNGRMPSPIRAMGDVLPLGSFQNEWVTQPSMATGFTLPLGLSYETLKPLVAELQSEGPFWSVLGGRQSGKSTALMSLLYFLLDQYPQAVQITLMPFRRGPLAGLEEAGGRLAVINRPEAKVEALEAFGASITDEPDSLHVLIMDDAGLAFASGDQPLINAINQLGDQLRMSAQENFLIVIADLYSNLKSPQTFSSSFLKLFQQSQTGLFFSLDDTDMQWFNTRVSLIYKKTLKWLPGRGFFVSKGESTYLQCPALTQETLNRLIEERAGLWEK
jgi:hypothetical protein